MRRKRKRILAGALAIAALIVVVAIATGPSDKGGEAATDRTATSGETLVVAVPGDPPSLDPGPTYIFGWEFAQNMYSTLLTHKVDTEKQTYISDELAPALAESWEVAKDKKSVTLHLDPSATFSDGSPVTAEDVRYSAKRGIEGKLGYVATQYEAGGLTSVDQVQVVDEHTVRLQFPNGMSRLALPNLATEPLTILSKKYMESHSTASDPWASEYVNKHPMGSGPYELESWKPGQQLVLRARDDYWGDPKPQYKRIVYRIVPDDQTRALLLRSGTVDLAYSLSATQYKQLSADKSVQIISVPSAQDTVAFRMNPTVPPFDDANMRKAIIKAIPYDRIIEDALYGYATRSQSPCGVTTPGYREHSLYTTDLDEAKQLVADSKYASGDVPSFSLVVPTSYPERVSAAVLMQSSLKQIGVRMEIKKLPFAAYTDTAAEREFAANVHAMGPFFNDCLYWAYWMFDSRSPTNYIGYKNPAVDDATEQALTLQVGDTKTLDRLRKTVVDDTLVGDAIVAPLYQSNSTIAARRGLTNLIYWPDLAIHWQYVRPAAGASD